MKRIIVLNLILVFFLLGCSSEITLDNTDMNTDNSQLTTRESIEDSTTTISQVTTENTTSVITTEDNSGIIVGKEMALEVIDSYRESIYNILGVSSAESENKTTPLSYKINTLSKDDLSPSHLNNGIDLEWLDMSLMVLEFAEAMVNSDYNIGEESIINDIIEDKSIWGWSLKEDSTAKLSYDDEVMTLRISTLPNVSTFRFSYNDQGLMKLLRIEESFREEYIYVYVEDFVENSGLSFWNSQGNYRLYSSYETEDGGIYTVCFGNDGLVRFQSANHSVDGVGIYIDSYDGESKIRAVYDLMNMSHFDEFNEEGELFLDGELVSTTIDITVGPKFRESNKYTINAWIIIEGDENTLSIDEWGFESDITVSDILDNIESAKNNIDLSDLHFDYTADIQDVLNNLDNFTYYPLIEYEIKDLNPPVIKSAGIEYIDLNSSFNPLDYIEVYDVFDKDFSIDDVEVEGDVDTSTPGQYYYVTYKATDTSGNTNERTIKFLIVE
ncbi:DUF5011 domain-containing protein [Mycoplasmatota bacterium]|nr:DUF5011 domain-containing protein [Mycoplasmatota bacterium]